MAIGWNFDASQYKEKNFSVLPAGDYRVRIDEINEKTASSGNEMLEIILTVSGNKGKLWYYLVFMKDNPQMVNQKLGDIFMSFGITDTTVANYRAWVGKVGACRTKVRKSEEYGDKAEVSYFLSADDKRVAKLPAWEGDDLAVGATDGFEAMDADVPF